MKTVLVDSEEVTKVIQASDSSVAVIGIYICNPTTEDTSFSIYIADAGKSPPEFNPDGTLKSGNLETYFIRDQLLSASDTFFLNTEKILLHPGDSLYVKKGSSAGKLSVILSYENY